MDHFQSRLDKVTRLWKVKLGFSEWSLGLEKTGDNLVRANTLEGLGIASCGEQKSLFCKEEAQLKKIKETEQNSPKKPSQKIPTSNKKPTNSQKTPHQKHQQKKPTKSHQQPIQCRPTGKSQQHSGLVANMPWKMDSEGNWSVCTVVGLAKWL